MKIDFIKKENTLNLSTLGRIVMTLLFILTLCFWKSSVGHVAAAIVFALTSTTDYLDGYLAGRWQAVTNFGKFADPLVDKMSAMTAFIMLAELKMVPTWIAAVIICRELAVTGLRLLPVENGGTALAAVMPGKTKTFTQMFSIIFLLCYFSIISTLLLYMALISTIYPGYDYFKGAGFLFKDIFK